MFVLKHTDWTMNDGHDMYLYKSVSKNRWGGWDWKITANTEEARQWATEQSAAGYATRFTEGLFVPQFIDTSERDGKAANRKAIYYAASALYHRVHQMHDGYYEVSLPEIRTALDALTQAVGIAEHGHGI